jgi:hypothetical protein
MKKHNQKQLSRKQFSITKEIDYIISKAQDFDSRVVRLGRLILFSAESGDAWILDPDEKLALCLVREGEKEDFQVVETSNSFQIGWEVQYIIDNEKFLAISADGRMRLIFGYPTTEISNLAESFG